MNVELTDYLQTIALRDFFASPLTLFQKVRYNDCQPRLQQDLLRFTTLHNRPWAAELSTLRQF